LRRLCNALLMGLMPASLNTEYEVVQRRANDVNEAKYVVVQQRMGMPGTMPWPIATKQGKLEYIRWEWTFLYSKDREETFAK
jgi:hypothetical protein